MLPPLKLPVNVITISNIQMSTRSLTCSVYQQLLGIFLRIRLENSRRTSDL